MNWMQSCPFLCCITLFTYYQELVIFFSSSEDRLWKYMFMYVHRIIKIWLLSCTLWFVSYDDIVYNGKQIIRSETHRKKYLHGCIGWWSAEGLVCSALALNQIRLCKIYSIALWTFYNLLYWTKISQRHSIQRVT